MTLLYNCMLSEIRTSFATKNELLMHVFKRKRDTFWNSPPTKADGRIGDVVAVSQAINQQCRREEHAGRPTSCISIV